MQAAGDDLEAWPADAVEVGRVIGAWGVKGGLKVHPHAARPQGLFATKRWYLSPPERKTAVPGRLPAQPLPRLLRVIQAREHGDVVVATAQGIDDRDHAQALAGAAVHVARSSFPTPEADEYYWVDLIGLEVVNRQGESLGRVEGLQETGPHCVLRLTSTAGPEASRMIPFVSAYVDQVDLPGRRIVVDWGYDY